MSSTTIIKTTISGRNGSGAISAPEVLAGDLMLASYHPADPNGLIVTGMFKGVVQSDGEVDQILSGDASGETYVLVFLRMT